MPDFSRVVGGFAQVGGLVWAPGVGRLFFTSNGGLHFLDPNTGAVGGINLSGSRALGDLSVSPDGAFVLVTDTVVRFVPATPSHAAYYEAAYYRVSVADGRVETFTRPLQISERGSSDVAVLSDGRALLAGSGWTHLREFRATDPAPSLQSLPNPERFAAWTLEPSESRRYVLIGEPNNSAGRFQLFETVTGTTTTAYAGAFPGHFRAFINGVDISEKVGLIAVAGGETLVITDLSLRLVKDLSFDFKLRIQDIQFSPDGSRLFVTQGDSDLIAVFDTQTWAQLGSYRLQSKIPSASYATDGAMAFSQDGRLLFVDAAAGIEVIDLGARTVTPGLGDLSMPRFTVVEPMILPAGETTARSSLGYNLVSPETGRVLTLAGTLGVTGDTAIGVNAAIGDWRQQVVIEPSGVMRVAATTFTATGYRVSGFDGASFTNRGLMEISAPHEAVGVESYAQDGDYLNVGTMRITARDSAMGFSLVNLYAPHGFRNSGTIEVRDGGGQHGRSLGVILLSSTSSFRNDTGASILVAHNAPGAVRNIAVLIDADGAFRPTGDTYINAGLIQGDYALKFSQTSSHDFINHQRIFQNEATGVLRGEVALSGNGIKLQNAGLVEGPVSMGEFSETYDGSRGGRVTGMVSGGAGDDLLIGGPHFDNFQGNTGNDELRGGGGDDWVVGGKDNDNLHGDAGADLVYGNLGNDTCDGGDGADIVRGGQDNDVLRGGAGDDFISGDRGDDTIAGGVGADTFHTFGEAGIDRVVDFNLAEGDRVQLAAGTQYTLAQVGADTVISMTGGGQMVLIGVQLSALTPGWIFGA